jgi:hypothetical protein
VSENAIVKNAIVKNDSVKNAIVSKKNHQKPMT